MANRRRGCVDIPVWTLTALAQCGTVHDIVHQKTMEHVTLLHAQDITRQSASDTSALEAQYRADIGEDAATIGTTLGETVESAPSFSQVSNEGTAGNDDETLIFIAVGCGAGLIAIILIVVATVLCRKLRKSRRLPKKELPSPGATDFKSANSFGSTPMI